MSRFRYFGILAAPIAIAFVVAFAHTNRPSEPASMFTIGAGATVCFAVCSVVATLSLERNIRRGGTAKLRAKGKDPERLLLQLGVVALFAPAGLALILWALGWLAASLVYGFCALSFLFVIGWGWRYRSSLGGAVY